MSLLRVVLAVVAVFLVLLPLRILRRPGKRK
jgi:hypothetical protein